MRHPIIMENYRNELELLSLNFQTTDIAKVQAVADKCGCFIERVNELLGEGCKNCHCFTLGLDERKGVVPDSEFIELIIGDGTLIPADKGDIIVYSSSLAPTHSGKVEGAFVVSKWGRGHVWRHEILFVPESYGDKTKRYFIKSFEQLTERYRAYVEALCD